MCRLPVCPQIPGSAWDPSVPGVQYLFDYIQPWHPNAVSKKEWLQLGVADRLPCTSLGQRRQPTTGRSLPPHSLAWKFNLCIGQHRDALCTCSGADTRSQPVAISCPSSHFAFFAHTGGCSLSLAPALTLDLEHLVSFLRIHPCNDASLEASSLSSSIPSSSASLPGPKHITLLVPCTLKQH